MKKKKKNFYATKPFIRPHNMPVKKNQIFPGTLCLQTRGLKYDSSHLPQSDFLYSHYWAEFPCIAAGYSNTYSNNVGLFSFPNDPILRKQWVDEVKRTRDKWKGPGQYSVICSEHFKQECFEAETHLEEEFGLLKRRKLKPSAIPTILARPAVALTQKRAAPESSSFASNNYSSAEPVTSKRRKGTYEKRERSRVSFVYEATT